MINALNLFIGNSKLADIRTLLIYSSVNGFQIACHEQEAKNVTFHVLEIRINDICVDYGV